jgi:hypothetical protein
MQLAAVAELMMNELEWRQVEEDFMSQGFLAPTGEQVRQYVRESLREWVSAALDLNKVAQSAYVRSHRRTDVISSGAARTVLLIMPRCLSGFQGAIVLAERGLGIEAQALVRHVFECTFWMGYLNRYPVQAEAHFRSETLESEIGLFKTAERRLRGVSVEVRSQCAQQLSEMERERSMLPRAPSIEKIARLAGCSDNYYFYRDLSGAATHLSFKSIYRFLRHDQCGEIIGHEVGADVSASGKAIWLGCRALCLATDYLLQLTKDDTSAKELSEVSDRISTLEPHEFF